MQRIGKQARKASRQLSWVDGDAKNRALTAMADTIIINRESLQTANKKDLDAAKERGLSDAMVDRLRLTDAVIEGMAEGIRQIVALPDPVGEMSDLRRRPNGLQIGMMRVPLGVIGIIYESRPNVTADAAALCVKSGNAVILRGGSEAFHSNRAIAACLADGLATADLPAEAVQFIDTTDRAAVGALITCDDHVDVIIPRGGKGLIARITEESRIPVIKHLDGICHTYIDRYAEMEMADNLAFNGKMQRTGVCNATETLLVHQEIAAEFLPRIAKRLVDGSCELRGCAQTQSIVGGGITIREATEEDWKTEYLASILSVRVVDSLQQAMDHIEEYSSRHTEVIVTENHRRAMRFLRGVDSSSVMVNASSRFSDGFEYGLGAEMGISTDKLHVRGPVGLEGLTSQKWVVFGDGQLRG
ncbi:MAG: glutamate-5-semialdehyde dehydrogenase [Magnetococcales bacterium]|nr:glutamate-5-semialdehyde dehydrogenase [Magnetococcales bacterium]